MNTKNNDRGQGFANNMEDDKQRKDSSRTDETQRAQDTSDTSGTSDRDM